jgi:[ribosomal protein S5]-alanine N-acetyltransferase
MPLADIGLLATARTSLRAVQEADLADLLAVNGDAAATQYLPYDAWRGPEDALAWYQRMRGIVETGTARQLVIERTADHRVIGTALLFRHDAAAASVELGYVIGRPYWRQGFAREAIGALCDHAFEALGLRRIEAQADARNVGSTALLRRLGFVHEGRRRQCWVTRGEVCDADVYGCLPDDRDTAT